MMDYAYPLMALRWLMKIHILVLALVVAVAGTALAEETEERTTKSGYERTEKMAGPGSVPDQLEEDDEVKQPAFRFPWFDRALEPWFGFKSRVNEKSGLQFGVMYTAMYQTVSDAPEGAEDKAASGIVRLSGRWKLVGRDSANHGSLVFSVDNRHRLGTDIAPGDLGFEVGYLGIPGTLFTDVGTVLVDFNWQQAFNNGSSGLVVGRFDPNDFMDVLGYANPWTSFSNLSILFNPSIALHDASIGLAMGSYFGDQWFGLATLNDANGTVTEIEFFEGGAEFYSQVEFGWTPARDQRYFKNIHITGWHVDERENKGIEESEGLAVSANWTFDERFMIFFKGGWSDGTAPLYNESVTAGMIYHLAARSDLMGLGGNWASPSDETLDSQITGELFYRLQFSENLAFTPSLQAFIDPAMNPEEDLIWLASMRLRMTF